MATAPGCNSVDASSHTHNRAARNAIDCTAGRINYFRDQFRTNHFQNRRREPIEHASKRYRPWRNFTPNPVANWSGLVTIRRSLDQKRTTYFISGTTGGN